MSTTATLTTLPPCDLCKVAGDRVATAAYDAKTIHGPWAFMCEPHYLAHRAYPELGTGKGQRLVLRKESK